jgi:hypothetical protein
MSLLSSWLLAFAVLATGLHCGEGDLAAGSHRDRRLALKSNEKLPVRVVRFQASRAGDRLSARWVGQDGHDYVGTSRQPGGNEVQDIHVVLGGLDSRRKVATVVVTGDGADQWEFGTGRSCWRVELRRAPGSRIADLFLEPARLEAGRSFHVVIGYEDGTKREADFRGKKADPNRKMPGRSLSARWVGQDGHDCVNPGVSVGPDGLQDVRIHLSRINTRVPLRSIRVESKDGGRWEFGLNPGAFANAELVRDAKDQAEGDLCFQPDRDLSGQSLTITVVAEDQKTDTTTLLAGPIDPKLEMPGTPLPRISASPAIVHWLGQDGKNSARPGDVHVELKGLPTSPAIVGVVLNDAVRATWIHRDSTKVAIPDVPEAEPLVWRKGTDGTSADFFFTPYRESEGDTYTVRLLNSDGSSTLAHFVGAKCDLGRLGSVRVSDNVEAKIGDDLQALVDRYGTVSLSEGTYRLTQPLILNRPVRITSRGKATLLFAQGGAEPPWPTALEIRESNTTLEGFAVRFEGPVRWKADVSWGPAVIGLPDGPGENQKGPRTNLAFKNLDLESPPVEKPSEWAEAPRLIRLLRARNGMVADNRLRGGMIEFGDGPWLIENNEFRGTVPGTFSHCVFGGHHVHDVVIRGTRTVAVEPSGKTWRFLVLTGTGYHDVIERNRIEHLGSRDGDTISWMNAPEIILTESYSVYYEGKILGLSSDGRIVRTGQPQIDGIGCGYLVSLLDGPAAGNWRRVEQVVDTRTFLVDPPIPAGTVHISIAPGFVSDLYQENRIDLRAGKRSSGFILVGNHYGTRLLRNHVSGGDTAIRLTACPTERPNIWGWTHNPFLGGTVDGNTLEDAVRGSELGVEHDKYMKSNQGRTYMSVRLTNNVIGWSPQFLDALERSGTKDPMVGLIIGFVSSHDAGELTVVAEGNRLEAPANRRPIPAMVIHAANYNSQKIVNKRFTQLSPADTRPGQSREANARNGNTPR